MAIHRNRPQTSKTSDTIETIKHSHQRAHIATLTVADVLALWPRAASVFVRYRLACVGCVMSPFEQLSDVPRIYGLDEERFLGEVAQAVEVVESVGRQPKNKGDKRG